MIQTIYRITAQHPDNVGKTEPIVSLHTDYQIVNRMCNNMEKAGWIVSLEYVTARWKMMT